MRVAKQGSLRRLLQAESLEQRLQLTYGAPALVSVNDGGSAAGNSASYLSDQTLSADGRFLVFATDPSDIATSQIQINLLEM